MEKLVEVVTANAVAESVLPNALESITETVTAAPVVVTDVVKKGWWANSSKLTKGLIIGGVLAVAGAAVWYFGFRKKEEEITYEEVHSDPEKNEEELANERAASVINKLESNNSVNPATLPNGGVGCSELRTAFDSNNDFIKCDGTWYIKTKANPSDKSQVGKFPEWNPLQEGQLIIEQLTSRYPKD